jgi:hypothetical protein
MNLPAAWTAALPAQGGVGSARGLAKIYSLLASGGSWNGRQLIPTAVLSWASQPVANGNGHGHGHTTNGHRPPAQRPGQPGVIQLLREADATERQQASTPQSPAGATEARPAGFRPEQIAALSAPLDRARISSREQGRGRVNYLQGWVLIEVSGDIEN